MFALTTIFLFLATTLIQALPAASCINWKAFNATGVNLGGWLAQEAVIDPPFWRQYGGNATDEWNLCAHLGSQCGPVLERRYATYITLDTIDTLAASGINVLRIPTTYAAWVRVPGSQLYTGNQVSFLKNIAEYAVARHGMHIVLDVHSLPGGVHGMGFGEAEGHFGWFGNETALAYSYQAVDAAIEFIAASRFPGSYTLEPVNEPVDNPDLAAFGTPAALSDEGAAYLLRYVKKVLARVQAVDARIPVMFQGGFKGEAYWSREFADTDNVVFDVHNYYFAGRPTDSDTVTEVICEDAKASAGDGKFPVFVGEWSIQTASDNKFANRAKNLNTGLFAFGKYTRGSAYWTARFYGDVPVDGEGVQGDYWNYETFIDLAIIDPAERVANCS